MGIVNYFEKRIQKSADLRYGREIIVEIACKNVNGSKLSILDIGAGSGIDLDNVKQAILQKMGGGSFYMQ